MQETLNIFGKNQTEIGSLESNLVLRTKGRVYIRYGKKYIELLDDKGNLNIKIPKTISKIDSVDKIKDDGFYLVNEDLYAYCGGINLKIASSEKESISYNEEQNLTQEQISLAQKNIGLSFDNIDEAKEHVEKGIVFINNNIYYISEGKDTKLC